MKTEEVAKKVVELVRKQAWYDALDLYDDNIVSVEATTLCVRKVDCIDGTPLIDVKPYFVSIDSFPHARRP